MCLEGFEARGRRTKEKPFQCAHCVCSTCHTRLLDENDHRCPVCRAPRQGFSAAEAEPDPGRNHQPPVLADVLAELGIENLQGQLFAGPGLVTGAARGYGGNGSYTGFPVRPPATTMFFPVEPPATLYSEHPPSVARQDANAHWQSIEATLRRVMQGMAQGNGSRVPPDLLGGAMSAHDMHTLLDFGASSGYGNQSIHSLPDAIRALLDVPSVPLAEWAALHSGRASRAQGSAQPARGRGRTGRRVAGMLGPRRAGQ